MVGFGDQPVVISFIDGGGQMGRQRGIKSQRRGGGSRDGGGGQAVKLGIGLHGGSGKAGEHWGNEFNYRDIGHGNSFVYYI